MRLLLERGWVGSPGLALTFSGFCPSPAQEQIL